MSLYIAQERGGGNTLRQINLTKFLLLCKQMLTDEFLTPARPILTPATTAARMEEVFVSNPAKWLIDLGNSKTDVPVDGLVPVKRYQRAELQLYTVATVLRTACSVIDAVLFEGARNDRSLPTQALVFVSDGPSGDQSFAEAEAGLELGHRAAALSQDMRLSATPSLCVQSLFARGKLISDPIPKWATRTANRLRDIAQEVSVYPAKCAYPA